MACSGTKEAQFLNSFLKNDLSPEMIWNYKKIVPLHTIDMACNGTKEVEFLNSFLKNAPSPEMIRN